MERMWKEDMSACPQTLIVTINFFLKKAFTMMKLHYSPGACSMAPHIVAHEVGLPLTLDKLDAKTKKTQDGRDFLQVNPKGYVPALVLDDGQVLTESAVICQYLADQGRGLIGKPGTMERYRALEWLNFISSELHKGMGALFDRSLEETRRNAIVERLRTRLSVLEPVLTKHAYLMGDAMTAPDAYLFTVLGWAKSVKVELPQFVKPYLERMAARPSVQAAMKAEGLM
jgi:glutathione S-transferase